MKLSTIAVWIVAICLFANAGFSFARTQAKVSMDVR